MSGVMEKRYRPMGRPRKYLRILRELEEDELYTPAAIAQFAEERCMLEGMTLEEIRREKQRIRASLGRFSQDRPGQFPEEGDGMVQLKGQAAIRAWYGWRWKQDM